MLGQLRAAQAQQQEGGDQGEGPTQEGTVDQLVGYIAESKKLIENIFKNVQVTAPQLKPLLVPVVQGLSSLDKEVQQMKAGAQPPSGGRAQGANMPGSVLAA